MESLNEYRRIQEAVRGDQIKLIAVGAIENETQASEQFYLRNHLINYVLVGTLYKDIQASEMQQIRLKWKIV